MPKTTHEKYDFLRQFITFHKYNKNKSDMAVWCPFCNNPNQHKLKMILNLEKGVYHCWVCNSKGTSIPWVIKRLSAQHYDKSLEYFPNRNQTLSDNEWSSILQGLSDEATLTITPIQVDLPNGFELCVSNLGSRNPDIRDVVHYLTKRGCSEHKMWMLRFGVSRDSNFHRMLIIPSFNADGDLNYYTCRKIDASTTKDSALFKKIVENKTPVILALDDDAYQKAVKIAQDLMYYDIDVKMMDTSAAKDVGDMSVEMFQEYYNLACKIEPDDLLLSKIQVI